MERTDAPPKAQERQEYAMGKGTAEGGEARAALWRAGFYAAIRKHMREAIEEILHEEGEEAPGAWRGYRAPGHDWNEGAATDSSRRHRGAGESARRKT